MKRRNLLKSVGMSSIFVVGFDKTVSSARATETKSERVVTRLRGKKRQRTLQSVRRNEDVKKLVEKYRDESWIPRFDRAKCGQVRGEDTGLRRIAVLPFEKRGRGDSRKSDTEQTIVLWKDDRNEQSVTGHRLLEDGTTADYHRKIIEEEHTVADDGIIEQTNHANIENAGGISTEDNLSDGGGSSCLYLDTYCVDFNLSCISFIVGALGLACSGSLVACLATALLEGGAYYTGDGCNVCDKYTTEAKAKPVCNCPSCY